MPAFVPRYVLAQVHRWAVHMSRLSFLIEHIQGVKNVFADLLARWLLGHRTEKATYGSTMKLYQSIVLGEMETDDVDLIEIKNAQQMHNPPDDVAMSPNGEWKKGDKV